MYQNANLKDYIEQSSSVNMQSIILAEWNMNFSDNIAELGNYRYRPTILSPTEANFGVVKSTWAKETSASTTKYYYGATDSETILNTGINLTTAEPTIVASVNQTEKMLYSLTDVVSRFRPRSGINKIRYFGDNYLNYANSKMHEQPRFYLSSKDDRFKYWNSYRVESSGTTGIERGIGLTATGNGDYFADDIAPFVVYNEAIPANRIVVKMQTGVGDVDNGPYKKSNNEVYNDPFYEDPANTGNLVNQKTPAIWKIQYLNTSGTWTTAKSFTLNELRANGKRIIGSDGYVELSYGITNAPATFRLLGEYVSQYSLPLDGAIGDAYLVPDPTNVSAGTVYVWNGTNWTTNSFVPTYGWYLSEDGLASKKSILTSITSPDFYGSASTIYTPTYREFQFIQGIRIVVDTMTQYRSSFDLIEMSPRLVADLSERAVDFSVTKIASDIGNTGIPVGQLLASTGSLSIFDYDQSLNEYNVLTANAGKITGSLIAKISSKNLQVKFYEQIIDDRQYPTTTDYFVPIKTMYVDGFPEVSTSDRRATLKLRDLLFYFESIVATPILLRNVSVSYAIAALLDSIGFSNYKFYRNAGEAEDKIPYFFVAPDTTVAEVLNSIAQSTQTAMFFDEDNNLIVMSRNYIMPTVAERGTDLTLYGTKDFAQNGIIKNDSLNTVLANIVSLDAQDNQVYNGGKITYSNRYIQKSYSTIQEAGMLNKGQTYKYKPVLLWEVSGTEALRPTNDEVGNQSAYSLSALVLNSELSSTLPTVSAGKIIDNVMDFGQSIYWLTRYSGYLYANGEIIKYDAVEHMVTGETAPVWIKDITEYEKYFSKLPFNGKMFPTGKVRIYAEPDYDSVGAVKEGAVAKHGRAQFGTKVAKHTVLDEQNEWIAEGDTVGHKTFQMDSKWIFKEDDNYNHQYAETRYKLNTAAGSTGSTIKLTTDTKGLAAGMYIYPGPIKTVATQTPTFASGNMTIASTSHGFVIGNQVKISGVVPATYNGTYTVLSVGTGTFTVANKNSASGAITTAGTVAQMPNHLGHNSISSGTKIKSIDSSTQITITKPLATTLPANTTLYATNLLLEPLGMIEYDTNIDSIGFLTDKPDVTGVSKDFFDSSSYTESPDTQTADKSKPNAVIKSSALYVQGPTEFNPLKSATVFAYNHTNGQYTITNGHPFKVGDSVVISGLTSGNGTVTVTDIAFDSITTSNTGTVSASAQNGTAEKILQNSSNAVSYVYKNYEADCSHAYSFGTRMRIVGKPLPTKEAVNEAKQTPVGGEVLNTYKDSSGKTYDIAGTGGGIAINIDPSQNKNIGYYFEIDAMTSDSIVDNVGTGEKTVTTVPNVFFYKVLKGANSKKAIPVVLWYGNAPILVDNGQFVGMSKSMSTKTPTVYDLMVETEELGQASNGSYSRKFYLYLNGKRIAIVQDDDAIPVTTTNKNLALFVRGSGLALFEHVYAIGDNSTKPNSPSTKKNVFSDDKLDNENYRKYIMNPAILDTYLKELGSNQHPKYSIYFEEFGTIMRECAYFNVRYEKAYPALYSKVSPTFNDSQGYIVSNFRSNPYGAEFMVFNATDFALNLDESTGNYLRIQGVTFTQQSSHDLTVDEYFQKNSELNNYSNYSQLNNKYIDIQNSRNTYGKKDFTISGNYIQNLDTANNLMTWMVDKVMKPKKSVGVSIFANPMIQLGDIVTIDYEVDNILQNSTARFVVYHIEYQRGSSGPEMKLYLSEVV